MSAPTRAASPKGLSGEKLLDDFAVAELHASTHRRIHFFAKVDAQCA